jgi:preprotein translocase subunit SecF
MKRVIRFSNARYLFFAFSGLLMLLGVVGFVLNHGLNLGVDFKAGISFQFQVAPASFSVQYSGPDSAQISIPAGEEALTSPGDIIFTVTSAVNGAKTTYPFRYADYATVQDLVNAIRAKVPGVTVTIRGDANANPKELIPLPRPADIKAAAATINLQPGAGRGVQASIPDVRALLPSMGDFTLQVVNPAENQEFIARFPVPPGADESTFQDATQTALLKLLEGQYGAGQIIIKRTEFVGARMAQTLGTQTFYLVVIALGLILVYMLVRFHPWIYGVAAVLGILHDAIIMIAYDAVFRIEVDAGTIAAILTILGYSINDTIVNFDRTRENLGLMRGESLRTIIDTSVTQTLSRTFITSGATLLTVIALDILTTGSIRNFAINMTVGIVEGTYSTFISSFIVIEWMRFSDARRKRREQERFGIPIAGAPGERKPALAAAAAVAADENGGRVVEPDAVPGAFKSEAELEVGTPSPDGEPVAEPAAGQPAPAATPPAAPPPSASPQPAPAQPRPNVLLFPGSEGSRKHKKHRRRHH